MKQLHILVLSLVLSVILTACSSADGNYAGSEYMPDMAHSVAVEANTNNEYYYNTWNDRSTIPLQDLIQPRSTVSGTVPRGYAGGAQVSDNESANGISVPTNGHVPYHYADSPEGRLQAMEELTGNPFPITEAGLIKGGELYNIFCGICHGSAGNGLGYIYDEDQNPNAKYPLAPANFLRDEFYAASNGRYYHAIYYGYNAMGAYKDKISYEERWQVIHYIRSLQAKELKMEYNADVNTLNPVFGTPVAMMPAGGMHQSDHGHGETMMAAESVEVPSTVTTTLKK